MDRWIDGWMDGRIRKWMEGWMKRPVEDRELHTRPGSLARWLVWLRQAE